MKTIASICAALLGACLLGSPSNAATGDPTALFESFAQVADGPAPQTLVGGDAAVTNFQSGPDSAPYVRDGYLTTTNPDAAVGGSYRIARLGADVTSVGATFAFTPWATKDGLLCLSIQGASIADGNPVPTAPVHLVVSPGGWALDVNTEAGTGVETVAMGGFNTPLTADGETLYSVRVELDRDSGKVRLLLPDGSQYTFSNPAFTQAGRYVYVEPFKSPVAGRIPEQTNALVREWWADTAAVDLSDPAPVPVVTTEPAAVEPDPVVPTVVPVLSPVAPRWVRASRKNAKVLVRWGIVADAETYRVKCGRRSFETSRGFARLAARADRCKVRAVNTSGASGWSVTRVR